MTKGTTSRGSRHKLVHMPCRRCGKRAFHKQTHICGACGFGASAKRRHYNWAKPHRKK